MDMEERRSGLVVPKTKSEPPKRYGPIEIRGEEQRERVRVALLQLWDAMEMSAGGGILQGTSVWSGRYHLYRLVGESLLGLDCPEKEVLT